MHTALSGVCCLPSNFTVYYDRLCLLIGPHARRLLLQRVHIFARVARKGRFYLCVVLTHRVHTCSHDRPLFTPRPRVRLQKRFRMRRPSPETIKPNDPPPPPSCPRCLVSRLVSRFCLCPCPCPCPCPYPPPSTLAPLHPVTITHLFDSRTFRLSTPMEAT